ncbi:MAG: hypothetical protein KQH63_17300 [Desulfobulbaceae bacterium]|nr:hypothetical protein [Desulfobulbaceae bacterium]
MKRKVLYNVVAVFFISSAISCMPINATERGAEPKETVASAAMTEPAPEPAAMEAEKAPAPMLMAQLDMQDAKPVDPKTINPARKITPGGSALYEKAPEPLTVTQCAQCHTSVFMKIKNNGGRHQIHCQDCHQLFHAYNPTKNNFQEIMPKCTQCHVEPHGPQFTDCMTCHIIPHTPLNVPLNDLLEGQCGNCHTGPSGELTKYPSKHTEQGCATCHHTKHGNIPSCMECHDTHIPNQTLEACKSCHPVHKPLEITYEAGQETTCSACHDGVYETWTASPSKHSGVSCVDCHPVHGQIPQCSMCHTQPHDPKMLAKFPRCLDCHIDPHNPPVNK